MFLKILCMFISVCVAPVVSGAVFELAHVCSQTIDVDERVFCDYKGIGTYKTTRFYEQINELQFTRWTEGMRLEINNETLPNLRILRIRSMEMKNTSFCSSIIFDSNHIPVRLEQFNITCKYTVTSKTTSTTPHITRDTSNTASVSKEVSKTTSTTPHITGETSNTASVSKEVSKKTSTTPHITRDTSNTASVSKEVSKTTSTTPHITRDTSNTASVSKEVSKTTSTTPHITRDTTNTASVSKEVSKKTSTTPHITRDTSNTASVSKEVSKKTSTTPHITRDTSNTASVSKETYFQTVTPLAVSAVASIFVIVILIVCHKCKMIRIKRIQFNNFTAELDSTNLESTRANLESTRANLESTCTTSLHDSTLHSNRSTDIFELSSVTVCDASTSTAPHEHFTRYQANLS